MKLSESVDLFFRPLDLSNAKVGRLGVQILETDVLVPFSRFPKDHITLGEAFEGFIIFGSTGSGKTSGSGKLIASSLLEHKIGGLVCSVKKDEPMLWRSLCDDSGRSSDLIMFQPQGNFRFNFLDYEARMTPDTIDASTNIASLLCEIISIIQPDTSGIGDPFWEQTLKELLRHTIFLLLGSEVPLTVSNIVKLVTSAPQGGSMSGIHMMSEKSVFHDAFQRLKVASKVNPVQKEYCAHYWTHTFSSLAPKTRSVIISSLTSMLDNLLREPLHHLFCTDSTVTPECIDQGKILVVGMPIHEYRDTGKMANAIWKACLKRYLERRATSVPSFLWIDEFQELYDRSDEAFQATARSTKTISVYITQNLPILESKLKEHSNVTVLGFLGNLKTKIFHQNDDTKTNKWASELVGKVKKSQSSRTEQSFSFMSSRYRPNTYTTSMQWEDRIPSSYFSSLKTGGKKHRKMVSGLVFNADKRFFYDKQAKTFYFRQTR